MLGLRYRKNGSYKKLHTSYCEGVSAIRLTLKNKEVLRVCRSVFLTFLFAVSFAAHSQNKELKFDHLSTNEGLSQSTVTCILQDSRGFMWFGTRDGLNKYDGYKFIIYKNNPQDPTSISNNNIMDIIEDEKGNLWIATHAGGLNMYDRVTDKFTSYRYNKNNPNSILSNTLSCVYKDRKNNLWIGSYIGLNLFDIKNKKFIAYTFNENDSTSLGDNDITRIIEDSDENLWVATNTGGVNLFNKEKQTFTRFTNDKKDPHSLPDNSVRYLYEDHNKNFWIGTYGGGLSLYNRNTKKFKNYKHDPLDPTSLSNNMVFSIGEDNKGNLWVGTENRGLNIFDPATDSFIHHINIETDKSSLNNNSVYYIFKDTRGNMWIGTYSGGINFLKTKEPKFKHYEKNPGTNSLNNSTVLSFYEDSKENIWIGTDGGGINILDKKTSTFSYYKHEKGNPNSICGNFVLTLIEDHDKNLWVGTYGDGATMITNKKVFKHFKHDPLNPASISGDNVWVIFEDSEQNLWLGTYGHGLNMYNRKTDSFIRYEHNDSDPSSLSNNRIQSIHEDNRGNLWVGTNNGGLNLFDKKSKKFFRYIHESDVKNNLGDNTINCLLEDKLGNLWLGTNDGLNYFNTRSNIFTTYTDRDGLPNNIIWGILQDAHENLWISTNNGLSKYSIKNKSFENFTVADGLQSKEFKKAYLKSRKGLLYFGGVNGFNEFNPDSVKSLSFDSPLLLTDFKIFNSKVPIVDMEDSPLKKHINEAEEITISYRESVISLEFASLNYTAPEKKFYAYMLQGFDKDWINIGAKNTATYTNLDPGEYFFKVKGQNNDGSWSTNIRSLRIYITPPFWKTWWFQTLSISLFVTGVFLFIRIRINSVHKQKLHLEALVKERTDEVVQQKEDLQSQSDFLENVNAELISQREEAEKARADAERANQAKSIFLATMSHEIRTPMNGVLGMASLLSETIQTNEQKEYTETIKSSGESLLTVINDILDFSKIESGNMELEEKDFDLRTCIEEVLDLFAVKASQTGLDLIYEIDYIVPTQIIGDSLRLRQVILNLVSNAIKFTHKGEIFVGVHLLKTKDNILELGFEIRDTGIGIPAEKIDRLFKAFSQVDSSTTRKYGGTGLGLIICEKLVGLMGGAIVVESRLGVGTVFTFSIKTRVSTESTRTYVHHSISGLEGKKVLIVDDNSTHQIILRNQLEQWKMIPTTTSSSKEALAMKISDFDLVLTDMQMPEMDGIQLAQQIKNQCPELPIMLLSSIGDEHSKLNTALFAAVLTKPVKQNILRKQILMRLTDHPENEFLSETPVNKKLSIEFAIEFPLNILIAEDNPVNQTLAVRTLNKLGYRPIVADNGLLVLQEIEKAHYDIILMDVQMPEMDGLEATRFIRKRSGKQPIIIAMTANAMSGDREMCLQAGMDDYISKPIKLEYVVTTLQKWSLHLQQQLT